MKIFLAFLLILAVSVECSRACRFDQEGQVLFTYKYIYWVVCHNGQPHKCGNAQGELPETRPFCLRHRRPSSPTKY
ncbi:unnamed protein product [Caenorhabditis angaria]|uniref:Uncharacterized protein n=1 Tax=Caenorhabditis angaria TaxID=860376 RepID=A0A9P1N116_9PELO|nr:unnamed protein product [Caenorhabditis angaria]